MDRKTCMCALVISILATAPLCRAAPDAVFLEQLTWMEVKQAIDAGKTTVIIPTGGTEQNGPHMALGKHNVIVTHAAERIARRLGNALVAPVVTYVPEGDVHNPRGHLLFPGTITLPEEHFAALVEYASRSLALHGFKHIVLIGDSGGNWRGLQTVEKKLNREWTDSDVRVHYVAGFNRGRRFREWLNQRGESDEAIGSHAGIMDTSVMLAVDPGMVRPDQLAPSDDFERTGVLGDPTRASAEYGRRGLQFQIEGAVDEISRRTSPSNP